MSGGTDAPVVIGTVGTITVRISFDSVVCCVANQTDTPLCDPGVWTRQQV